MLFKYNKHNNNHHFIIMSLFSAMIFATIFVTNDYLDLYIDKYLKTKDNFHKGKVIKLGIHFVKIFLLTFIVCYIFWYTFGWIA